MCLALWRDEFKCILEIRQTERLTGKQPGPPAQSQGVWRLLEPMVDTTCRRTYEHANV